MRVNLNRFLLFLLIISIVTIKCSDEQLSYEEIEKRLPTMIEKIKKDIIPALLESTKLRDGYVHEIYTLVNEAKPEITDGPITLKENKYLIQVTFFSYGKYGKINKTLILSLLITPDEIKSVGIVSYYRVGKISRSGKFIFKDRSSEGAREILNYDKDAQ